MSIDGAGNSVYEVDSIPEPDPALNPHHNAWITRDTLVASGGEGARDWDWSTGRYWKVTNPSKHNELGSPVAYKLTPRDVVPVMVQEGSYIYDRARFVAAQPVGDAATTPTEKFAAGDYMYQSPDAQGLPRVHRRRRAAGEHRRGALVHRRRAPRRAAGGLAGDAVRLHRLSTSSRSASSTATRRWTSRRHRRRPATTTSPRSRGIRRTWRASATRHLPAGPARSACRRR